MHDRQEVAGRGQIGRQAEKLGRDPAQTALCLEKGRTFSETPPPARSRFSLEALSAFEAPAQTLLPFGGASFSHQLDAIRSTSAVHTDTGSFDMKVRCTNTQTKVPASQLQNG